jgi:hypothetical protein
LGGQLSVCLRRGLSIASYYCSFNTYEANPSNRYGDTVLGIFDQLKHIGNFSVGEKSPVGHYLQLQKIFKKWAK